MKPKIVILGGGFGGVRCALDCAKKFGGQADVTIIDRNGYHYFTPALYEVAAAYQPGEDSFALRLRKAIAIPYEEIFSGRNIDVVQAEISSVDLSGRQVMLDSGDHIDFDYLVFGLGSQVADFGIPGVYEYAYQFKTTDDAVALHTKLEESFKAAAVKTISLPMKFLVIGAGFTGIELAAELVMSARKLSARYGLDSRSFSVVIFEAAPTILPMVNNRERSLIMNRLTELGIVVMANSAIENVLSDSVKLKTGQTIAGTAVIWTAGVQASKIPATVHGLPVTSRGKIIVDENLRVQNTEHVFAFGDCIEYIDSKTQKPVPGLAYAAQAQGSLIAENLYRVLKTKKLRAYIPEYDSWVAPVGGKFAVAHIGGLGTYSGFIGWIIRGIIDLRYFSSILPFFKALGLFGHDVMIFSKND